MRVPLIIVMFHEDVEMMFLWKKKDKYLKEGRLEDVLALMQVLALDEDSHRSEEGLKSELPSRPQSETSWLALAKAHPEFFRVDERRKHPIALVTRHVSEGSGKKRPPLTPEHTQALLTVAIELHDREIKRRQRWAVLIPIWVAVISGIAVIGKAFLPNGT